MHWAGWIRRIRQTKKTPTIFLWPNPPAVNGYDISPFTVMSQCGYKLSSAWLPKTALCSMRTESPECCPSSSTPPQPWTSSRWPSLVSMADPRCPAIKYLTCLFAIENYHKLPITPSPVGCEILSPLLLCRLESHWKSLEALHGEHLPSSPIQLLKTWAPWAPTLFNFCSSTPLSASNAVRAWQLEHAGTTQIRQIDPNRWYGDHGDIHYLTSSNII